MREPIFAPAALRQLKALRAYDQRILMEAIRTHLIEADPFDETRNKFRLARTSPHADFELRSGQLRVFYRVDENGELYIGLIGRKVGNRLFVEREEFKL